MTKAPYALERAALGAFTALFFFAALIVTLSGSMVATVALAGALLVPYGLCVALARPFIFPLGLYVLLVPFDNLLGTGSFGTITKYLGMLAGVFLLLWSLRGRRPLRAGKSTMILFALAAWMIVSVLWSLDQRTAIQSMSTYAGLILLYAVMAIVPISASSFRMLLVLTVIGGLAAAAYGIHAFYHDPTIAQNRALTRLVVQAGETSIDPNQYANALLLPLAITTMWALRSRRVAAKLSGVGFLTLFTTAILLSGSREALIGVLLIFIYYILRSRHRLQLAIAGVVVLSFASTVQTSIWTRFSTALETGGSGRTSIWAVALEAAKHRPVLGYGIGNFQEAYNLFYIGVHQTYPYGWSSPAHNLVLHYLVELGFIGLLLIGLFFWFQFRSLRHIDKDNPLCDYRITLEASLIAIAFVSLTIDLFTYKYAWLVFFSIAFLRNAAEQRYFNAAMRPASPAMMASLPARS